jgi:hypothetical protein
MYRIIIGILLLLTSSCSSKDELLTELSINCMCEITSYWELSTDSQTSNTREVTFKNSRLFEFGVTEESFAISSAILLNDRYSDESFTTVKLNLVKGDASKQDVSTYSFERNQIEMNSSSYFESKKLMNEFIGSIYNKDLPKNFGLTNIKESLEEYKPIFEQLNDGLGEGYVDTRIVGFSVQDSTYRINAGIYYESGNLLLFSSRLAETTGGLKITGFDF